MKVCCCCSSLRLGLVQMSVSRDKHANLAKALGNIRKAAALGAEMVILPEFFNAPYGREGVQGNYAETLCKEKSENLTVSALAAEAKQHRIWIVGGSIPEEEKCANGTRYYNTCPIINPSGDLVHAYRKINLFDVSIPDRGVLFQESSFLSPGSTPCPPINLSSDAAFAVAICFDVRFPKLFDQICRTKNVALVVVPAAFTAQTGAMHWHLLMRARALDHQVFLAACSPARSQTVGDYQAYGHSLVVDPMANVIAEAGEGEELLMVNIDLEAVKEARMAIPIK